MHRNVELALYGAIERGFEVIPGIDHFQFHHTLSIWVNKEAMRKYLGNGAHLKAMKVFSKIATGKVFGYESKILPTWAEALRIWDEQGRSV